MAAEAIFNNSKQAWHNATETAVSAKEDTRARYNTEKKIGITTDSFDKWVSENVSTKAGFIMILCVANERLVRAVYSSTNSTITPTH